MNTDKVISTIINSGKMGYLALAGNGLSCLGMLSSVPGLSNFLIGSEVLYSTAMFDNFLGKAPEQYCSEQTARKLAMEAFQRGYKLIPNNTIGFGSTSVLTKTEEREGRKNVLYVAAQSKVFTKSISCEIPKLPRDLQERLVSEIILRFIANQFTTEDFLFEYRKFITEEKIRLSTDLEENLLFGDKPTYLSYNMLSCKTAMLSGAFAPLHKGHIEIKELASKQLGLPVTYELSVVNADKGKIDYIELDNRLRNFSLENKIDGGLPDSVIVTNAPRFLEKAILFPNTIFIVGADTIKRVLDPRYYGNSIDNLKTVLNEFKSLGTTFIVAPRMIDGVLNTLVEDEFSKGLCFPLKEMPKNLDVSSSQKRKQSQKGN